MTMHNEVEPVPVRPPIRLGQFLKLAGVVMDGVEAKMLIASGDVVLNGTPCLQRGAHLNVGDVVTVSTIDGNASFLVTERD